MDPSGDVLLDEDGNSSSSSCDDGLTLFQRGGAISDKKSSIPLKPHKDLAWDDDAVLDSFALFVNSHGKNPATFVNWTPKIPLAPRPHDQTRHSTSKREADLSPLNNWQPQTLSFPRWIMKEDADDSLGQPSQNNDNGETAVLSTTTTDSTN